MKDLLSRLIPFRISPLLLFILFTIPVSILIPDDTHSNPETPPDMIYVPEGYFQMGSDGEGFEDEKPSHLVYTAGFFIDKYEVSNAQYEEFVKAIGHPRPRYWDDERFNKPDHPVVGVSWLDAVAYATWKNRRLPTEAEWEKTARGGDARIFPWGGKFDKGVFFFFANVFGADDGFSYTAPVNYHQGGASPYGALNMAGNVWEWCVDWYDKDYYRFGPEMNPAGPESGKARILRGGSWVNDIDGVRSTRRAHNDPDVRNDMYGFRTVLPRQ